MMARNGAGDLARGEGRQSEWSISHRPSASLRRRRPPQPRLRPERRWIAAYGWGLVHMLRERGPRCKRGLGCLLHLAGHPSQQPRPSRGENRTALGQFRSQGNRRFNRAGDAPSSARNRRRSPLGYALKGGTGSYWQLSHAEFSVIWSCVPQAHAIAARKTRRRRSRGRWR